jgi:RHS repeat-associated protein
MLFQGREWLAEVRLNDHRFRYYSPELQRWLSRDRLFEGADMLIYRFVSNCPADFVDPDGQILPIIVIGIIWWGTTIEVGAPGPEDEIEGGMPYLDTAIDLLPVGKPAKLLRCKKKPGKLGDFKGTDALRAENKAARDAAKNANLNKDQEKTLHDIISGQGYTREEIFEIAQEVANGARR